LTEFLRPRAIRASDDVSEFRCGEARLDDWLSRRSLRSEKWGGARTFVTTPASEDSNTIVAGYYCLSASSLVRSESPGRLTRNMPDPIPVALIGRLAVAEQYGGQGLGASLLQDAVVRAISAADAIGFRAIVVHSLNDGAKSFYRRFGFTPFPDASRALYLLTADAVETVRHAL